MQGTASVGGNLDLGSHHPRHKYVTLCLHRRDKREATALQFSRVGEVQTIKNVKLRMFVMAHSRR